MLLILRILVPMVLALCMARPVLEKLRSGLGGGSRVSLVLVVDDTASMAVARGGQRMIEEARARAIRVVRSLPRGSDVAVVVPSDPENPWVAPTLDLQGAVRRLEALSPLQAEPARDLAARRPAGLRGMAVEAVEPR